MLEGVVFSFLFLLRNSKLDTWDAAQALAVGKPLDKMESVPEVAMEGFPGAESLHELGVSVGPNQVSHTHDQVMPFLFVCNMAAAHAHCRLHCTACQQLSAWAAADNDRMHRCKELQSFIPLLCTAGANLCTWLSKGMLLLLHVLVCICIFDYGLLRHVVHAWPSVYRRGSCAQRALRLLKIYVCHLICLEVCVLECMGQ